MASSFIQPSTPSSFTFLQGTLPLSPPSTSQRARFFDAMSSVPLNAIDPMLLVGVEEPEDVADHSAIFSKKRSELIGYEPIALPTKQPRSRAAKGDLLERTYRRWRLIYFNRAMDMDVVKEIYGETPDPDKLARAVKKFGQHHDNWFVQTKQYMTVQVNNALADPVSGPLLAREKDTVALAEHFLKLYTPQNFEYGFHWCNNHVHVAASGNLINEYCMYLYSNFAAHLKLNIDWAATFPRNEDADFNDGWLKQWWENGLAMSDEYDVKPNMVKMRPVGVTGKRGPRKKKYDFPPPDKNPRILLRKGKTGLASPPSPSGSGLCL